MASNLDETVFRGRVSNGTIVLAEQAQLPEGAEVEVRLAPNGQSPSPAEAEPTIWQKMVELARKYESLPSDLPEDLAANHDHYLHGLPKRQ